MAEAPKQRYITPNPFTRQAAYIGLILTAFMLACLGSPVLIEAPAEPTAVKTTPIPAPTVTPSPPTVWIDPDLPSGLLHQLIIPNIYAQGSNLDSEYQFSLHPDHPLTTRVYALVEPFFTTRDSFSLQRLRQIWSGEEDSFTLLIQEKDAVLWEKQWKTAPSQNVQTLAAPPDPDAYAGNPAVLYLVPYDELSPNWKVLQVDGLSPLDRDFDIIAYPLSIRFGFSSKKDIPPDLIHQPGLPASNRDPDYITTLVMTGTTALTRAIGYKMEQHGVSYPAEKIGNWLRDADITHISNEVSFTPNCPPADYDQRSMVFCSRPDYLGLLDDVGADVIELTGNHNLDWGTKPYLYSLEQYPLHDMRVYAGGANVVEARQPLLLEDHGNKIAFLGCNYAGPPNAIAGVNSPGAAFCYTDYFVQAIQRLREQGYLVVMTLQHAEYYHLKLSEKQRADFRQLADAGATIVQGSQAHFPQPMEFYGNSFIHYGLGNLFFDQMDIPVVGTRREFIDRYTIYNGRLISVELLTAMLEDYSQPRPMTISEREAFLEEIFKASSQIP
jgi:poly-gamma-glutamate synthesis protein (capsule biosynthesis protein)